MGGLTQPKIKDRRLSDNIKMFETTKEEKPRLDTAESVLRYMKNQREETQRAEEAERNRISQQLEEVRQQREVSARAQQQHEAEISARTNQQRALEQTGAVDSSGDTSKPYNPTSSASATVEGLGAERDHRRKRNQLTAYLGI